MPTYLPPATEYQFAQDLFSHRVTSEREVMLGQDALRPDPLTMAIRRGVAVIGRLFTRDEESTPAIELAPVAEDAPIRLQARDRYDRAA